MKKLIRLILILIVLIIAAVVAAFFYIDSLAKRGIERGATYALGVETKLDSANVGIFKGEFSLAGLRIANPEGFEADHFMTLKEGATAVTWSSLREDTVRLPHLDLTGVDVNIIKKGGKANYGIILENLKRFEGKPKPDAKKFVIERVTVRDIVAHVNIDALGAVGGGGIAGTVGDLGGAVGDVAGTVGGVIPDAGVIGKTAGEFTKLDVPIDEIILEDVGSGTTGGVLLAELSDVLIQAILTAIVEKAGGVGGLPADILGDLQGQLAQLEGLEKLADVKSLGKLLDATGNLGEKAKDELEGALDKVGGELGGLIGGDKDDKNEDPKRRGGGRRGGGDGGAGGKPDR